MKMLHVTIQTNKFETEIEFYEKEVGLTLLRDMRPKKDLVFLANEAGDTCIEIINNPDAENAGNGNLSIGFGTDDPEGKREQMMSEGYEVTPMISPVPGTEFFFVQDPAGVRIQFISE